MEELAPAVQVDWAPDEVRRFLKAYQKYGCDFYKISKTVGGGKAPEMCHALWQKHQALLTMDKNFVTEQDFLAKVQAVEEPYTMETDEIEVPDVGLNGDDDGDEKHHEAMTKVEDGNEDEGNYRDKDVSDIEADVAEAVVSMASPQKGMSMRDKDKEEASTSLGRSERQRRTPKRLTDISPGRRTPNSLSRRSRSAQYSKRKGDGDGEDDGDGIYEYYDEAIISLSESARKRQRVRSRLQFDIKKSPSPVKQKSSSQRRQEKAEEQRGIVALLALAVAGNEEEGYPERRLSTSYGKRVRPDEETDEEYDEEEEEEEEEEEDALGVLLDDDRDEDYRGEGVRWGGGSSSRPRRTPQTTPHKSRTRPNSTHTTPKPRARSSMASPTRARDLLRSPGWMASDLSLMDDGDIHSDSKEYHFHSPGFPHHRYPPGFVPSPNNPLPRLRRRKPLPYRHTTRISPIKSLFGRRQSLGTAGIISSKLGLGGLSSAQDDAQKSSMNLTPLERHLKKVFSPALRRWSIFEFFYPAVDKSWFMDSTMEGLLMHMGLPPDKKLTRKQWSALRVGFGRPRRLSVNFLRESRAKLEAHRVLARRLYASSSPDPNTAAVLPRPLNVGQRVLARHPVTRHYYDGSVLTVAPDAYRIQFDRTELGVELVRDIDVMPTQPWENLPVAVLATRPRLFVGGHLVLNGRVIQPPAPAPIQRSVHSTTMATAAPAPTPAAAPAGMPPLHMVTNPQPLPSPVKVPAVDPTLMAELATILDRKEALLAQLRLMNEEAASGLHTDSATGTTSTAFTQAYSKVVLKLKETNDAVTKKIAELEQGSETGEWAGEIAGSVEGARLPPELLQGPITAQTLAAAGLNQARRVIELCKSRLAESLAGRVALQIANQQAQEISGDVVEHGEKSAGAGASTYLEKEKDTRLEMENPKATENVEKYSEQQLNEQLPEGLLMSAMLPEHGIGALEPVIEGAVWTLALLQQGADKLVPPIALTAALDNSLLNVKPKAVANAALYTEVEAAMRSLKSLLLAQ